MKEWLLAGFYLSFGKEKPLTVHLRSHFLANEIENMYLSRIAAYGFFLSLGRVINFFF